MQGLRLHALAQLAEEQIVEDLNATGVAATNSDSASAKYGTYFKVSVQS